MHKISPIALIVFLISCQPQSESENRRSTEVVEEKDPNKIYNFMSEELPPKELTTSEQQKRQKNLEGAKQAYNANPDSLELIIWYGRRLAYTGSFLEAIQVYSDGLILFPHSYRLRRHRGHRYITTRQINKAIEDFELAAYYSLNAENSIEPDGLPNKLNRPLSNDKFNIWYHFGLSYYLKGRFDKALSAYVKCQDFSDNNDLKVATTYWQYLTYKKLGNVNQADELLASINSKMKLIENDGYHKLLLLFKGEKEVDPLLREASNEDGLLDPTLAYGIGCYYQHNGKMEKANEIFLRVLESPSWDAFGYIASEAELTTIFPVP